MLTLPIEIINIILEQCSTMKNAKYIMYVNSRGDFNYRFNTNYTGYQALETMYSTRFAYNYNINLLVHEGTLSFAHNATRVQVLSIRNNIAKIVIYGCFIQNQQWLLFDVDMNRYAETDQRMIANDLSLLFQNPVLPKNGMYMYTVGNHHCSQKIAIGKLRLLIGTMFLEVKCYRDNAEEGCWIKTIDDDWDYVIADTYHNDYDDFVDDNDDDDFVDEYVNENDDIAWQNAQMAPMLQMYM